MLINRAYAVYKAGGEIKINIKKNYYSAISVVAEVDNLVSDPKEKLIF